MKAIEIIEQLHNHFKSTDNTFFHEECGLTYDTGLHINRIGYATNLNIDVIQKAVASKVDLIVTHHDAWGFIGDLKDQCMSLLIENNISHYYNHLPLDDADFGTNSGLACELGLKVIKKVNDESGFMCGVIAETKTPMLFSDFIMVTENSLNEAVLQWKFNDRMINKVHILCGAGHLTSDMKLAIEEECDLYLTGEKILYTIEFARLNKLNLVVGSHTFIEYFGVRAMCDLIKKDFSEVEIIDLKEDHLEALGYPSVK